MNAIETHALTRRFGPRTAVDGLDLTVRQGELFALLGVNGAGKTTTLRMLSGLLQPTSGEADILGFRLTQQPQEIKRRINLSPQETAVAPNLTVRENLELIAGIYGASRREAAQRAAETIAEFHLGEVERSRAKTLSGGWQRRLSIAMALISQPQLVFLDEPTLGLDVLARRELWQVIRSLRGRVTVILTTHYLEEAEALSDRIGILSHGRLRICGTAQELCAAAGQECEALGYRPILLTDQLCCEAREAGSFLASILRTHGGSGESLAFIAGGETVVRLTGKGKGGRNQELALAASAGIAGMEGAAVFSVGSDGTDGPTDAAGGYVDGETLAALEKAGLDLFGVLADNDAYHALKAVDGLIVTGPTGTNVNDVAVALLHR